jgi:hypothetical protein
VLLLPLLPQMLLVGRCCCWLVCRPTACQCQQTAQTLNLRPLQAPLLLLLLRHRCCLLLHRCCCRGLALLLLLLLLALLLLLVCRRAPCSPLAPQSRLGSPSQ